MKVHNQIKLTFKVQIIKFLTITYFVKSTFQNLIIKKKLVNLNFPLY